MTDATPPAEASEPPAPTSPAAISSPAVRGFFAADHAAAPGDGKVYALGAFFSLLRFPSFPAVLPSLGIVAVLEIPFHDTMKDHVTTIGLRGPNDEELPLQIQAIFRAAPSIDSQFGEAGSVPLAVTVTNVEFREPGKYHLVLSLDGKELARCGFRAMQVIGVPHQQGGS